MPMPIEMDLQPHSIFKQLLSKRHPGRPPPATSANPLGNASCESYENLGSEAKRSENARSTGPTGRRIRVAREN